MWNVVICRGAELADIEFENQKQMSVVDEIDRHFLYFVKWNYMQSDELADVKFENPEYMPIVDEIDCNFLYLRNVVMCRMAELADVEFEIRNIYQL